MEQERGRYGKRERKGKRGWLKEFSQENKGLRQKIEGVGNGREGNERRVNWMSKTGEKTEKNGDKE